MGATAPTHSAKVRAHDRALLNKRQILCLCITQGDQASIVGGVVEYIKELQQVLQSLQAKKQRKAYSEVMSPRPVSSPRPPPLSPRPSPMSPRLGLPISP